MLTTGFAVHRRLVSSVLFASAVTGSYSLSQAQQLKSTNELTSGECHVQLRDGRLVVGNAHIERTWRLDDGTLIPESLLSLPERTQWFTPAAKPAPTPPSASAAKTVHLRAGFGVFGATESPSLRAELEVTGTGESVLYEFQVFSEADGIRMWLKQNPPKGLNVSSGLRHGDHSTDVLERFRVSNSHLRLTQVVLYDRTDEHNELVFENEWLLAANESPLKLQGDLFSLEDTVTGNGLVFLKEAPLPGIAAVGARYDAVVSLTHQTAAPSVDQYDVSFLGHGFIGSGTGYPYTVLAYRGGTVGRTAAVHKYQRQIHTYDPERDGLLLSNTWGDRSQETHLTEAFVRGEIDAGKRLGVDVMELDDGWQNGRSMNASTPGGIWNGYWEADPGFWQPSKTRFPHGIGPLVDYAHSKGMKFGLWYAPDSFSNFQSWHRDAEKLLALHRTDGVDAFKLDSVKIDTKEGERNYFALLDQLQNETGGKVQIDLDVTAERRQGYFGKISASPLFVENRYSDTHRYWPHQTLRNFWKLSRWVDPLRLRMEFLNSSRNAGLYGDDPLAPARYSPACLFAITMMGSPLAWFESTGLPNSYIDNAAPVIKRWKQERESINRGEVLPIGDAPDGTTWTGFVSRSADSRGGYALVFRELNKEDEWTLPEGLFPSGQFNISTLAGEGSITSSPSGLRVRIPQPLGFVWVKLEPVAVPQIRRP